MKNIAIIDINKLIYNAKQIKKQLSKNQKLYAVVKADAYGHGIETVANYLYNYVDAYVVALVEEGVALRQSGIDKDILVLYGVYCNEDCIKAIEYNLILTIGSTNDLKLIKNATRIAKKQINVHLAVNTGMNRIGFDSIKEVESICKSIKNSKKIIIKGIYSHYYNAENIVDVQKQQKLFDEFINIAKLYFNNIVSHISASGGFLMGDKYDAVRIGLLLYGYTPFNTKIIKVKPIMKVYSNVILTRRVAKNEYFLYGKDVLNEDNDYTLIRYGYADGLSRTSTIKINKCMDICAIKGKYNNKFTILYENAVQLAEKYGTISYEVLTKIASRSQKVYRR